MATLEQAHGHAGHEAADATVGQYLTFLLGGDVFALGILSIKEIIEYEEVTGVPMMPRSVRGVINLRGAVVPVVDLSARFARQSAAVSKRTCIVIVEVRHAEEQLMLGVIVDSVCEVLEIAAHDIEPAPAFGAHIRVDFIAGMGKVDGRFVIILNAAKVLSCEELGTPAPALHGERGG